VIFDGDPSADEAFLGDRDEELRGTVLEHVRPGQRTLNEATGGVLTAKQAPTGPEPPQRMVCALDGVAVSIVSQTACFQEQLS
jgi:hypothetical protein